MDFRRSATQRDAGGRKRGPRSGGAIVTTTTHVGRRTTNALLCSLIAIGLAAATAHADLTASYDGTFAVKKPKETAPLAAALTQLGVGVSGTLAIESSDPSAGGVYYVSGLVKGSKLTLTGGNQYGMQLKWKGKGGNALSGTASVRGPGKKMKGKLVLTRRVVPGPGSGPETCDNDFFTGQVMGRVLNPICSNCHTQGGTASTANFRVTSTDPLATQASVGQNIDTAAPASSRILMKPLGTLPHGGGVQLVSGSPEFQILEQWVNQVAAGQQCSSTPEVPMVPMEPADLLVRASMDVRGMRPTLYELDQVTADKNTYAALVDQYLHTPEFLERVKDVYDDALLLRREDFSDESRDETAAIYGEASELIAYIVANDRPFSEIGTADYTVSNELFQRDTTRMPFPMDPVVGTTWQPTHYTDGRPHAGLLSTSAFYQVWDTNDTNKNRRRANRWSIVFHCYNFLDTPVDVTRNVDNNDQNAVLNAVTTRPDCRACHDRLDPLASFLFPLDNAGLDNDGGTAPDDFFSGDPERWRTANRRPPAVYTIPGTDIRDMGRLLTENPKFAECQAKRAFKMLFLRDPKSSAEFSTLSDIAQQWRSQDNYNYRALVRRWMLSDVYTSRPTNGDPDWVRRVSPERFELLIKDLTGFVWTRDPDDDQDDADPASDPPRTEPVSLLTNEERGFKIIFGGINGVSVSGRSTALNASVVNVHRKVAALAADYLVLHDMATPDGYRKLLDGVNMTESPADEALMRAFIARIDRRIYGRSLDPSSSEVTVWFDLFKNLYNDSSQGGTGSGQVPGSQSERAWRGMLTAMLRSPKILLY
jgi:Protein of unknown function (DUF1549)